MSAHTPGPWFVVGNSGVSIGTSVNGKRLDIAWTAIGESAQADARLIAAAPELLDALRKLCKAEEEYGDSTNAAVNREWFAALDVIAKAEAK